jgi:hypothetical protein
MVYKYLNLRLKEQIFSQLLDGLLKINRQQFRLEPLIFVDLFGIRY